MSSECMRQQLAISEWMDEELGAHEVSAMFLHLAECEECRSFWKNAAAAERKLLESGKVGGSEKLDELIGSIGRTSGMRDRAPERRNGEIRVTSHEQVHFPYPIAAIVAILAISLGFVIGSGLNSGGTAGKGEPQVIYVSVLPSLTVTGRIGE